jgi:hypothetical protein
MSHEWICSCLELPPDSWPPDHYTLLGLAPGEADSGQVEQRVCERMEKLRPYQLTHTEQATEAMNRLAQALVCLTDPAARQAYDALLLSRQVARPARRSDVGSSRRRRQLGATRLLGRSRPFPRWLFFAWIVWLALGAAGFVTLARNFSAIQASWRGDPGVIQQGQRTRKATADGVVPGPRTRP